MPKIACTLYHARDSNEIHDMLGQQRDRKQRRAASILHQLSDECNKHDTFERLPLRCNRSAQESCANVYGIPLKLV